MYYTHICPVCGERFRPAPMHVYKTTERGKLVCSYSCMMKFRKDERRRRCLRK